MTGKDFFQSGEIAIRPETVELSNEEAERKDAYQFEGQVLDSTPRGNVLRYKIKVGDVSIHSDALFRTKALFENGQKVQITILKKNCIPIEDESANNL